jgi:hypothetical protein
LVAVVPAELVTQRLRFVNYARGALVGVEVLEGVMVALQLAAGLRRPRAELSDARSSQALLEVHRLMAVAGDELDAVVADQLAGCAMLDDGGLHGSSGSVAMNRRVVVVPIAKRAVIKDVDHPRR